MTRGNPNSLLGYNREYLEKKFGSDYLEKIGGDVITETSETRNSSDGVTNTRKRSHEHHLYKTALCENWKQRGRCTREACTFAHGENELREKSSVGSGFRRKDIESTPMCVNYHVRGRCLRENCRYLHNEDQEENTNIVGEKLPSSKGSAPPPLEEIFRDALSLDSFESGLKQVEKIRSSLSSIHCAFVVMRGDGKPMAIVCRDMLRNPQTRDGRAENLKELACIQLGIKNPDSMKLMAEVKAELVGCTDFMVNFVSGDAAEVYFLVPM